MSGEKAIRLVPEVSIIMPAYNAGRFIDKAICSVQNQTFTDWELIVLDDCSQDGTCSVVERLASEDGRITLVRNEVNLGVARTRNRGFDLCKGKYIALLDSDDVWHPEKLEKQIAKMQRTDSDFSYCSYAIVGENGEKVKENYIVPEDVGFNSLMAENVIGCSTVVLNSSIIKKYRFETDFYHEDYVLWLTLLQAGYKAAGCTEVLVDWRYIVNSRSFNKQKSARNRWRIYRDYLKLPVMKSICFFIRYLAAGIKKYSNIHFGNAKLE